MTAAPPLPAGAVLVWGGAGHAKMLRPTLARLGRPVVAVVERDASRAAALPFPDARWLADEAAVRAWAAETGAAAAGVAVTLAIGGHNGAERCRLEDLLAGLGLHPLTLVHDRAWVADTADLAPGCQILPMAAVGEEAVLGRQCIVNTNASVDHECRLGEGVHVMPGATLAGCVTVGDHATIGSNATILPRVTIGAGCMVGAGAVVTHDLPPGTTAVGVPARPLPAPSAAAAPPSAQGA